MPSAWDTLSSGYIMTNSMSLGYRLLHHLESEPPKPFSISGSCARSFHALRPEVILFPYLTGALFLHSINSMRTSLSLEPG